MLYIHIGYPKTATTTLQKRVFPYLEEVNYLGRYYDRIDDAHKTYEALRSMLRLDDKENQKVRLFKENQATKSLQYAIASSNKPSLISAEGIIAQCLAPKPNLLNPRNPGPAPRLKCVLQNIKKICDSANVGKVKLIITVRSHEDFLCSFFAEAYKDRYGRISQTKNFEGLLDLITSDSNLIDANAFHYSKVEDICHEIFGIGSTKLLSFEWLKVDAEAFSRELSEFLSIDETQVFAKLKEVTNENSRSSASGKIRMHRKNVKFYLDEIKGLVLPNRSLGLGGLLGPVLEKVQQGEEFWKPGQIQIKRIEEYFAEDRATINRRHNNFL